MQHTKRYLSCFPTVYFALPYLIYNKAALHPFLSLSLHLYFMPFFNYLAFIYICFYLAALIEVPLRGALHKGCNPYAML